MVLERRNRWDHIWVSANGRCPLTGGVLTLQKWPRKLINTLSNTKCTLCFMEHSWQCKDSRDASAGLWTYHAEAEYILTSFEIHIPYEFTWIEAIHASLLSFWPRKKFPVFIPHWHVVNVAMPPTNETQLWTPQRPTVTLPENESAMCLFTLGVAKTAVKHLAAYKPKQQINGKGKAKKEKR